MIPQPPSPKPSLEELLRIKRAERPAVDFWPRFEAELRAKQLAAIVERRPWWQRLASARVGTVAGIGAATAVAVVAMLRLPASQSPVNSPDSPVAVSQPSAFLETAVETAPVTSMVVAAPVAPAVPAPNAVVAAAEAGDSETKRPALQGNSNIVNPVLVSVKFSEIQVTPPRAAMELALPAATLAFAENVTPVAAAEPLAAISSPLDQRVARFASIAELAMLASPVAPSLRSRLTPRDSDLRDRDFGRLSAQGNALALKVW